MLTGKAAFVIGGSGGIGPASAQMLLANGGCVAITGRDGSVYLPGTMSLLETLVPDQLPFCPILDPKKACLTYYSAKYSHLELT